MYIYIYIYISFYLFLLNYFLIFIFDIAKLLNHYFLLIFFWCNKYVCGSSKETDDYYSGREQDIGCFP